MNPHALAAFEDELEKISESKIAGFSDTVRLLAPSMKAVGGGALVGGLSNFIRDPGYDPQTGERRSRLGAAAKGAISGGLIGGAASTASKAMSLNNFQKAKILREYRNFTAPKVAPTGEPAIGKVRRAAGAAAPPAEGGIGAINLSSQPEAKAYQKAPPSPGWLAQKAKKQQDVFDAYQASRDAGVGRTMAYLQARKLGHALTALPVY